MKNPSLERLVGSAPRRGSRLCRMLAGAALALLAVPGVHAASGRSVAPSVQRFEQATALRAALESQPPGARNWKDYERVLNAYRAIYHKDPQSSKADDSVIAVAELLAEKGRTLGQRKPLEDAIAQYEFLRKQYPYSQYRFSALLTEGQIYLQDLNQPDKAKAAFEEFLRRYPRRTEAAQARDGLAAIARGKAAPEQAASPTLNQAPEPAPASPPASPQAGSGIEERAAQPAPKPAADEPVESAATAAADDSSRESGHPWTTVSRIRHWAVAGDSRIAINLGDRAPYEAARLAHPDRIYFDLKGTRLAAGLKADAEAVPGDGLLQRIRAAQFSPEVTRVVLNIAPDADYSAFYLPNPWRLIIDIHPRGSVQAPAIPIKTGVAAPQPASAVLKASVESVQQAGSSIGQPSRNRAAEAKAAVAANPVPVSGAAAPEDRQAYSVRQAHPTSNGKPSLVRTLGLKIGRIVIDPGHGGHDSGTLGPGGIEEKDVVLDVSLRLGKLLEQRLGEEVVYTRNSDTFIPLEERTAIANRAHADLFLSIHANSSRDKSVRGVESYYLNFTTDPQALQVAARENAVSNEPIYNLSDLVKKITLSDKVEESREFAIDVQKSLYRGLERGNPGMRNRGVKRAPFVVLIGAKMPSILAEISFLTNPTDARDLSRPEYRERIAEALYRGISQYIHGLSGIRLAEAPNENADLAMGR